VFTGGGGIEYSVRHSGLIYRFCREEKEDNMKTMRTIYMVSFIVLISILVIFVFRWPWPSPGGPVSEPTSVVLVRQTLTGEVLLRYVRGEQLHPEGTYVWKDQPVKLPVQEGQSPQPSGVPSAVLFPQNDRIYVARAIFDIGGKGGRQER
jgi:hypothetical protein